VNATQAVDVTPFTRYDDQWVEGAGGAGGIFSDAYTRLKITSSVAGDGAPGKSDPLPYAGRSAFQRYFIGKDFAINLAVKVKAGGVDATVPLVTLGHQSDSQNGEKWSRQVTYSVENSELFLVKADGGDSNPNIQITLRGTLDYSAHVAATALQIVETLAKDLSPESKLATTLSKNAAAKRAEAVDVAIGKLFGKDIDETHGSDKDIRYWKWGQGINVTLSIPPDESGFDSAGKKQVGIWTISFDEPRPSAFVDWRICDPSGYSSLPWAADGTNAKLRCAQDHDSAVAAVLRDVKASSVLSFVPTETGGKTDNMGKIVTSASWYNGVTVDLGDATKAAAAAPDFCLNISNDMAALGLSSVDTGIVVWAVITGTPKLPGRDKLKADATCRKLAPLLTARQ
jgi:hypothetical protein